MMMLHTNVYTMMADPFYSFDTFEVEVPNLKYI